MSTPQRGSEIKKSFHRVANIILAIGAFGWFGGFLLAIFSGAVPRWVELPLGGLDSVAVDATGNIYCGIAAYGRIQSYDAKGRFRHGWSAKSHGGGLRIRLNANGNIEAFVTRGHTRFTFDGMGKIVEELPLSSDEFYEHRKQIDKQFQAAGNVDYFITGSYLFPRVIRQDGHGNETTVVSTPFYIWPFMVPLPAWCFAVGGLLLHGWVDRMFKNRWRKK